MSMLVIKDLQENKELDRKAMKAIIGGRRTRLHAGQPRRRAHLGPRRLFK